MTAASGFTDARANTATYATFVMFCAIGRLDVI
jgi:hypothetical protein